MMPIAGFASTGVRVARMLVLCGLICVPAAHFAAAAARSEPAYEDNRSDAVSLIRSLYNALNRKEYLRAYSYWAEGATGQTFDAFEKGYRDTVRIRLKTGPVISEGAAGSAYYTVPAAIRTIDKSGRTVVFAGCYTLRLADPKIQANPPFQPMHIESGKLRRAKGHLSTSVPTSCDTQ